MDRIAKKIINLYSGLFWKKLFARIRILDAPYKQVEKMVPKKGKIIELGCGEGLFSNYLALGSDQRDIYGVDLDGNRIKHANRGLSNTTFIHGDANEVNIPVADTIVLMHLLHHLGSYNKQDELLKKCTSKLSNQGKLIIIEVEPKLSLKYLIAFFVDHFLVSWIFERKLYSNIYFRKKEEWKTLLNDLGFKVNSCPGDKYKPFSHIIFECTKF